MLRWISVEYIEKIGKKNPDETEKSRNGKRNIYNVIRVLNINLIIT